MSPAPSPDYSTPVTTAAAAICPRCGGPIAQATGYGVYPVGMHGIAGDGRFFISTGRDGRQEGDADINDFSPMLYCDKCADGIFTDRMWKEVKALRVDMTEADVADEAGVDVRREVIDYSIVIEARRTGLSPQNARTRARALGKMWWDDQESAKRWLKDVTLSGLEGG